MSNTSNAEVINYIEKSGEALGAAQDFMEKVSAEQVKIASLTPAVAAEIHRLGLLDQAEVQPFVTKISSHEGAIGVLRKLASLLAESRRELSKQAAASPGRVVEPAADQASQKRSCFVGAPVGLGQMDAAKYASEVALGLAPAGQI